MHREYVYVIQCDLEGNQRLRVSQELGQLQIITMQLQEAYVKNEKDFAEKSKDGGGILSLRTHHQMCLSLCSLLALFLLGWRLYLPFC